MKFNISSKSNEIWQFQESKGMLSEILNKTDKDGPQIIEHNEKKYIILNENTYKKHLIARKSVLDVFLRSPHPDIDLEISRSKEAL
jgi:hypothetical protein